MLYEVITNVADVFPTPYIGALIDKGTEFNNIELRISSPDLEVHSLISGRPVVLEDRNAGSIIVLKKMEDVYKVINNLTNASLATSFEQIVGDSPAVITSYSIHYTKLYETAETTEWMHRKPYIVPISLCRVPCRSTRQKSSSS